MTRLLPLVLVLSGCAVAPTVRQAISPAGTLYTLILDANDNPCGTRHWKSGCYVKMSDGSHRVYVSSIAPEYVLHHEVRGHLDGGMQHTDWDPRGCAVVIVESAYYPKGATICVTEHGENVR